MSIANLKKLANAFNVPHAESTTAGHECLHCVCEAARKELKALVDAAVALTEMLEDGMPMAMHVLAWPVHVALHVDSQHVRGAGVHVGASSAEDGTTQGGRMRVLEEKVSAPSEKGGKARRNHASLLECRGYRQEIGKERSVVSIQPMDERSYWVHVGSGKWNSPGAECEKVEP
jgi:hypothetical protein